FRLRRHALVGVDTGQPDADEAFSLEPVSDQVVCAKADLSTDETAANARIEKLALVVLRGVVLDLPADQAIGRYWIGVAVDQLIVRFDAPGGVELPAVFVVEREVGACSSRPNEGRQERAQHRKFRALARGISHRFSGRAWSG